MSIFTSVDRTDRNQALPNIEKILERPLKVGSPEQECVKNVYARISNGTYSLSQLVNQVEKENKASSQGFSNPDYQHLHKKKTSILLLREGIKAKEQYYKSHPTLKKISNIFQKIFSMFGISTQIERATELKIKLESEINVQRRGVLSEYTSKAKTSTPGTASGASAKKGKGAEKDIYLKPGTLTKTKGKEHLLETEDGTTYVFKKKSQGKGEKGAAKQVVGLGRRLHKDLDRDSQFKGDEVIVLQLTDVFLVDHLMRKGAREVPIDDRDLSGLESLKREMILQNKLRGKSERFYPKIHDIVRTEKGIYVVVERFDGDLTKKAASSEKEKLIVARDLVKGLKRLHDSKVYHRDIKPENVFLEFDKKTNKVERAVIADFGEACTSQEKDKIKNRSGTSAYGSFRYHHEKVDASTFTSKDLELNDKAALGMTLYEKVVGKSVETKEKNKREQLKRVNELNPKTKMETILEYAPKPENMNSLEGISWQLMFEPEKISLAEAEKKLDKLYRAETFKIALE